jgi:CRP/FNR family transcriptional regulator
MQEKIKAHFSNFEIGLQEKIISTAVLKHFESGEIMIKTGQNIRSTALITSGLLKVYREDNEGNEFFMYYLQPGQACAVSMVCAAGRETSQVMVKAVTASDIIMIPLEYMEKWMSEFKTWYQFVVETYRARFEELLITIDHIAFRNMDERLEFYLKKHQQTLNHNIIPLTHQEIANELNSSREVISRLMKKLVERGKIIMHRNAIEIINL